MAAADHVADALKATNLRKSLLQAFAVRHELRDDPTFRLRHLLRLVRGPVALEGGRFTRDDIRAVARRLQGSPLRAEVTFHHRVSGPRLLHLPDNVDVSWTLGAHDLRGNPPWPPFPATLTHFDVTVPNASPSYLSELFAALPQRTQLALTLPDELAEGPALRVPVGLRLVLLGLPAATLRGRTLERLTRLVTLRDLTVSDDSSAPAWSHRTDEVPAACRLYAPPSVDALSAPPHIFRLFSPPSSLANLKRLVLRGEHWTGVVAAMARLSDLAYVELEECAWEPQDAPCPDDTLGAQLAHWPLGHAVQTLRLRSPSLAAHLGEVRWPPALREVDLCCSLNEQERASLPGRTVLDKMNVLCRRLQQNLLNTLRPEGSQNIAFEVDGLGENDVEALRRRWPNMYFQGDGLDLDGASDED